MDKLAQISGLLEEIKKNFIAYEEATIALLSCGVDDVEHYIIMRGELAIAVDTLRESLAQLCFSVPEGEVLYKVAMGNIDFEQVPSEYQSIYYEAQAVRSVMNRIAQTEKQVLPRLEHFRDEALENIRMHQNVPKIKKYLTDLSGGSIEGSLRDNKA